MKTKLRKFFGYFKNSRVILLVFLLCAAAPVLILGFFFVHSAAGQMSEEHQSLTEQTAQRVRSILFDLTTSVYTISDSALSGSECMYLFASDMSSDTNQLYYQDISASLANLAENNASISSAHIYTDNPAIPDNTYITYDSGHYGNEEWYRKLTNDSWSEWILLSNSNPINQDKNQLSLIRRIPIVSPAYTAYLVIRLDSNNMKNRIGEDSHRIYITLEDGTIVYSSGAEAKGEILSLPEDYSGENEYIGRTKADGAPVLSVLRTLLPYRSDSKFIIEACDLSAFSGIARITDYYLVIIAIAIATIIAVILFFSKKLARQELINKQQEMEFKMLSAQINPHFLYNTLETIRMQALMSQNRDVAQSIKLLGKSMHYVLENTGTHMTTLEKELDHVKTYLMIQQIRFGDRINFTFEIDPEIHPETYPILPLLLQPIVENAVVHGLEDNTKQGFLKIGAASDDSFLHLSVRDSGRGMTEEELTAVRNRIDNAGTEPDVPHSSIALYNIRQRILLCYGIKSSMTVDSSPGMGTCVTLTLPHPSKTRKKQKENLWNRT